MRPEYLRLARDFERLVADFGGRLEGAVLEDVATLMSAIECIDRSVDVLRDRCDRDRLGADVLRALRDGSSPPEWAEELRARTAELRAVLVRRDVVAPFLAIAQDALSNAEQLRDCRTHDEYVARVVAEGRMTTELALTVAGDAGGDEFARFFVSLGEPANLVDKLRDARGDAARGEILLTPGPRLHLRLASEILRRLPGLLRLHPRPVSLLVWGAGYLLSSQSD
ncbi:MAG TPA: hypothetical protein VMI75_10955 [Polyangiaceae bacterium]|nr:hypothetical protein [Polyangiaceae bacterium]